MGCDISILLAPSEYTILLGTALGTLIMATPFYVLKDILKAIYEAFLNKVPTEKLYLSMLGLLYLLMREMRSAPIAQIETHLDDPKNSSIFKSFPDILAQPVLVSFICDYCRLIILGSARSFEIESLMDEEIHTLNSDWQKPYHTLQTMAEGLPALGIIAAVLGIIKALTNLNVDPSTLGHFIGSALIGTFAGIFFSYACIAPLAMQLKHVRSQKLRLFIATKQTLLAYINGSMPQIALEYGRKTIPEKYRPSIDTMERDAVTKIKIVA